MREHTWERIDCDYKGETTETPEDSSLIKTLVESVLSDKPPSTVWRLSVNGGHVYCIGDKSPIFIKN